VLTDVVIVPVEVIVPPLINPAVAIEVTVPLPLLLKVVQSAALKAPLFKADAVGTFKVITGVVVLLATVDERSVPLVPNVKAATDVTVPPLEGLLLVSVPPDKDSPLPIDISSIIPTPVVLLPTSLLVFIEVVIVPLVVIVPPLIKPAVAILVTVPLGMVGNVAYSRAVPNVFTLK
jgi:hypothetical protein